MDAVSGFSSALRMRVGKKGGVTLSRAGYGPLDHTALRHAPGS